MDNTLVTQTRAAMAAAEAAEVVACFLVDETEELAEPVTMWPIGELVANFLCFITFPFLFHYIWHFPETKFC